MKSKVMSLGSRLLLNKRAVIEYAIVLLKQQLSIEHTLHRSLASFFAHMCSALMAYAFCLKKYSLAAYPNILISFSLDQTHVNLGRFMKKHIKLLLLILCTFFLQALCFSMQNPHQKVADNDNVQQLVNTAANGWLDRVKNLVRKGIAANVKDPRGFTPLMAAAYNGHKEVVLFLLTKKAEVNAQNDTGVTALHLAAQAGMTEIVKVLLSAGAEVNIKCDLGQTALHSAVVNYKFKDIVIMLIEHGASVNVQDKAKFTALTYAIVKQHKEVIDILIEAGATLHLDCEIARDVAQGILLLQKNLQFSTGLVESMFESNMIVLPRDAAQRVLLLEKNSQLSTRLVELILKSNYSTVLIRGLIKEGFNVNTCLKDNRTPLMVAVCSGHIQLMEELIRANADPNMRDKKGWTPLMYAASRTDTKILEVLLKAGPMLEKRSEQGETAFMLAARNGNKDAANLLLAAGAKDEYGYAPLIHSLQDICGECAYCKMKKEKKELSKCAQCRIARYCSKDCQKSDWTKHKLYCQSQNKCSTKAVEDKIT